MKLKSLILFVLHVTFSSSKCFCISDSLNAENYINKAWNFVEKDPKKAIVFFDSAFSKIDTNQNPVLWGRYLNKKGALFMKRNQKDSALLYFLNSYRVRKKIQVETAKCLLNIGGYYLDKKQYNKAIIYFRRGIKSAGHENDFQSKSDILGNLGFIYQDKENYDSAIYFYKKANFINKKHNLKTSIDYLSIGSCFIDMNQPDSGYYYTQKAIFSAKKDSNLLDICYGYRNLGVISENRDSFQLALKFYTKSNYLARDLGNRDMLATTLRDISDVHEILNNHKKALLYFKKHHDTLLKIKHNQTKEQVLKLQTQFETKEAIKRSELLEKDNLLKAKDVKQLSLVAGTLLLLLVILLIIYAFYQQKQKNKFLEQQRHIDDMTRHKEMERFNAMLTGQEKERKRIADALHDQIGTLLSTVKHYLSSVSKTDKNELITKAEWQLDKAVEEMRKISHNLVDGVLVKFGLVAAIKDLAAVIRDGGKIKIKVITTGFDERLNNEMEIYIYRILQELVNNILKHAQATEIQINLKQKEEVIEMLIRDNGVGFDVQKIDKQKGTGINSIIQRVTIKDGTIDFNSSPQKGTQVKIQMPYQ